MYPEDFILREATQGLSFLRAQRAQQERDVYLRSQREFKLRNLIREQRTNNVGPVRRSRSGSLQSDKVNLYDQSEFGHEVGSAPTAVKPALTVPPIKIVKPKKLPVISGGDRRMFHPAGASAPPVTIYGNAARILTDAHTQPRFHNASAVVPCIQRSVRREVIFATRQNRGHHKRKRRTWLSRIEC